MSFIKHMYLSRKNKTKNMNLSRMRFLFSTQEVYLCRLDNKKFEPYLKFNLVNGVISHLDVNYPEWKGSYDMISFQTDVHNQYMDLTLKKCGKIFNFRLEYVNSKSFNKKGCNYAGKISDLDTIFYLIPKERFQKKTIKIKRRVKKQPYISV